ncbi:protein of unknown function [Xenorhabdus nematophila AN6/1]|nr:hypothetical protein XNA1_3430027 [Xenorhabdus nematophila str. Anatoliense]CEK22827.1 protein of unknown function [Xenorhabdus nematophila AN6/1]
MALFNRIVLNIIKQNTRIKDSLVTKRRSAIWSGKSALRVRKKGRLNLSETFFKTLQR